ncbi:MAG: hypothetical protein HC897_15710 [Thermoanaerobaculia bacterium]|nr:hypothetical protein [Thermoanaerobaculia bacterium]
MIAPLRRRHRRMTLVLGVVVFFLFLLALAGRAPEPTMSKLPPELGSENTP